MENGEHWFIFPMALTSSFIFLSFSTNRCTLFSFLDLHRKYFYISVDLDVVLLIDHWIMSLKSCLTEVLTSYLRPWQNAGLAFTLRCIFCLLQKKYTIEGSSFQIASFPWKALDGRRTGVFTLPMWWWSLWEYPDLFSVVTSLIPPHTEWIR